MANLVQISPPPVQNNTNDFVWLEWFRMVRDNLIRVGSRGALELLDLNASTNLPTTPTVLAPQTVTLLEAFSYDTGTGEITIEESGCYTLTILLNAKPSSSNKQVYFYATIDTGSGHQIRQYSARRHELVNNSESQIVWVSSNYFTKNTKVKLYVWADATVSVKTTDLPGTTPGTVTTPAVRILWA
jgi:hypothetical protein